MITQKKNRKGTKNSVSLDFDFTFKHGSTSLSNAGSTVSEYESEIKRCNQSVEKYALDAMSEIYNCTIFDSNQLVS